MEAAVKSLRFFATLSMATSFSAPSERLSILEVG
jgi:hypothetical protein